MSVHPSTRHALAPLFLRLILGIGFVFHGYGKLFAEGGHAGFAGMLSGIGVPAPEFMAWFVAILEFGGGIALILGIWIPLITALLTVNMLVAMFTVHLPAGFNFINITGMTESGPQFGLPGFEVNLLYIAGLLSLLASGPGAYNLVALTDRWTGAVPDHPEEERITDRLRRAG